MPTRTYSISELTRVFGLTHSTLRYYDRIGLLKPSGRFDSGERSYSEEDYQRLEQIWQFREAGLKLKEICGLLSAAETPGVQLLDKWLHEISASIVDLKNQQRILAAMRSRMASRSSIPVDPQLWVEMLEAAGSGPRTRKRWHCEFERRDPEAHGKYLLSLGISWEEVAKIRRWSQDGNES